MRKTVAVSLDEGLLERLDSERGEIPRSRYVERLIKKGAGAPSGPAPQPSDAPPTTAKESSNV